MLGPLRAGRAARFQRFDWSTQRLGEWHEIRPCRALVVEGVFALQPALRPLYDITVWVEAPRGVRLARGLERDGEAALAQWGEWMAGEDRYVSDHEPQAWVDLVVA